MAAPRDGALTTPSLAGASAWVITDGKIGDRVQCLGVAEQLGLAVTEHVVAPRAPWSWWAPWGAPDPRDIRFGAPWPRLAIASGRRAVPVLAAVKRRSGGSTFTVFLKQPANGAGAADFVWVPQHDRLRGPNVFVTLTSPSRLTAAGLAAARAAPDPRLAALPAPRAALLLGGPSGRYRFDDAMVGRLVAVAGAVMAAGHSLMVTPSRRTPPALTAALAALGGPGVPLFVWDGAGANPYLPMLALAEAVIVTGDSVNMMGEAALTGAPVHVVEPAGHSAKIARFVDGLVAAGAARRWSGALERFGYAPLDATPLIAAAVAAAVVRRGG